MGEGYNPREEKSASCLRRNAKNIPHSCLEGAAFESDSSTAIREFSKQG